MWLLVALFKEERTARGRKNLGGQAKTHVRHSASSGRAGRSGHGNLGMVGSFTFPSGLFLEKLYSKINSLLHSSVLSIIPLSGSCRQQCHLPGILFSADLVLFSSSTSWWPSLNSLQYINICQYTHILLVLLILLVHPGKKSVFCFSLSLAAMRPGLV